MKCLNRFVGALVVVISLLLCVTACQYRASADSHTTPDSLSVAAEAEVEAAAKAADTSRTIQLADSFVKQRLLSPVKVDFYKAMAFDRQGNDREMARYTKKVIEDYDSCPDEDEQFYGRSAISLSSYYLNMQQYEEALSVAMPALKRFEADADTHSDWRGFYLSVIGACQMQLNQAEEAEKNFELAYQTFKTYMTAKDYNVENFLTCIITVENISSYHLNSELAGELPKWNQRSQELLAWYRQQPGADTAYIETMDGVKALKRAISLAAQDKKAEAEQAYQQFLKTNYARTDEGRLSSTTYLAEAGRYSEAADIFQDYDRMAAEWGQTPNLDVIRTYLFPKFRINYQAGRKDSAMAVALKISTLIDSVVIRQKKDVAAQLATAYETQKKDRQIAEQQVRLSHVRTMGLVLVIIVLTVFFTIFSIVRHRAAKQEELARRRAEEVSQMKTNFIKLISHEIRTPLNVLNGFSQLLTTKSVELDEDTQERVAKGISDNAERITSLVNKMLELADVNGSTELRRHEDVAAQQIVMLAANESGITTASHLLFHVDYEQGADKVMLRTNLHKAARALSLLLDNAMKFTHPAEATGAAAAAQTARVSLRVSTTAGGMVTFAIEDTGIGVPPHEAEHIFEEFVQLDDYYYGTGIGLTVARSIARRLGGDIRLDTTFTPGARFVFTLPCKW